MSLDPRPLLDTAIRAARAGAAALAPFRERRNELAIAQKAQHDFVTAADLASEQAIRTVIAAEWPAHRVLGEEGEKLAIDGEEPLWIVDPLDGTTNFIHGLPIWSISIGCAVDGRVVAGAILDPSRGDLYTAARGYGARRGDEPLRVSPRDGLADALIGTGFPFRQLARFERYIDCFREVVRVTAGVRRPGSAALDLAAVAAGHYDGFWEEGLGPWDMAAGSLLIEEAGGVVTDFDGAADFLRTGAIVAGAPAVQRELLEIVARTMGR